MHVILRRLIIFNNGLSTYSSVSISLGKLKSADPERFWIAVEPTLESKLFHFPATFFEMMGT